MPEGEVDPREELRRDALIQGGMVRSEQPELPLVAECHVCGSVYGVKYNPFSDRFACDAHR